MSSCLSGKNMKTSFLLEKRGRKGNKRDKKGQKRTKRDKKGRKGNKKEQKGKIRDGFFQKDRYSFAFVSRLVDLPRQSMVWILADFRSSRIRSTEIWPRPGTRRSSSREALFMFTGKKPGLRLAQDSFGSVSKGKLPCWSKMMSDSEKPYLRRRKST